MKATKTLVIWLSVEQNTIYIQNSNYCSISMPMIMGEQFVHSGHNNLPLVLRNLTSMKAIVGPEDYAVSASSSYSSTLSHHSEGLVDPRVLKKFSGF
jgi:hypothetical protein